MFFSKGPVAHAPILEFLGRHAPYMGRTQEVLSFVNHALRTYEKPLLRYLANPLPPEDERYFVYKDLKVPTWMWFAQRLQNLKLLLEVGATFPVDMRYAEPFSDAINWPPGTFD